MIDAMRHFAFPKFVTRMVAPCVMAVFLSLCPAADEMTSRMKSESQLKDAREFYHQAALRLDENPSDKDAKAWLAARRDWQKSHRELIKALLKDWSRVHPSSTEFRALYKEIDGMMSEPSVSGGLRTYALWEAWVVLSDPSISKDHARQLVRFSKPGMAVKIANCIQKLGLPFESVGWDEQLTYALALIRSGKIKSARTQIDSLIGKVRAGGLKGSLDYDPEAGSARHRNKIDYLQTCYLLNALIAKSESNPTLTLDWISKARKLRSDSFSPEGSRIIAEIEHPK